MSKKALRPTGEIILYHVEDGRTRVECRFSGETVWRTQALLAEIYQKDVRAVNEHFQSLFEEGKLDPEATIRKSRTVRRERQREVWEARLNDSPAFKERWVLPNVGTVSEADSRPGGRGRIGRVHHALLRRSPRGRKK